MLGRSQLAHEAGRLRRQLQGPDVTLRRFDMSDYLFPRTKITFETAFPDLANVQVKVISLRGGGQPEQAATYTKDNFPGDGVKCSNPVCRNGGLPAIRIPLLIKKMISEKKMAAQEYVPCNGGLYRGQKRYNDCGWSFKIEITIQFKGDS